MYGIHLTVVLADCILLQKRAALNMALRGAQVIATACLFLAGKVEETPKPLNEVITKTYVLRHEKERREIALERIKRKVT